MNRKEQRSTSVRPVCLSPRLLAVAELVSSGARLADIGTDHAYIPIFLAESGRIEGAVACDVNSGPLQRAGDHIREHGLEDRIQTRLSDGFSQLKPGETNSAVIAGMGGGLMIRILKEGSCIAGCMEECILQPQSEIERVRAFLLEEGFSFLREDMVRDDGKYYVIMKVKPPSGDGNEYAAAGKWKEEELRYGKLLLEEKNPVLYEFLEREIRIKKDILSSLKREDSQRIEERKKELEKELDCAEKGLRYYALQ